MVKRPPIPYERFDEILGWLNPDREAAASIYIQLCHDLTKVFAWNHCADPEGLTDEVVDRVARKLPDVLPTYEGDPRSFFYGIARNVIRENSKLAKTQLSIDDVVVPIAPVLSSEDDTAIQREDCLQTCLQKLSTENRKLILEYYAKDKQAKIDHRVQLAAELGVSMKNLRVKAHRIRATLEECMEACLERLSKNG